MRTHRWKRLTTNQAEAAGLLPPVASPWSKFSPSDLGLGAPVCLAMSVGDVALMDYRCFHRGGANASTPCGACLYSHWCGRLVEQTGCVWALSKRAARGRGDEGGFLSTTYRKNLQNLWNVR